MNLVGVMSANAIKFDKNNICYYACGEDDGCVMCGYGGIPEHVEPQKCGEDACEWFEQPKPDMRTKIEEYIEELNQEIARCNKQEEAAKEIHGGYQGRISTLIDVVNDLQGILDELI